MLHAQSSLTFVWQGSTVSINMTSFDNCHWLEHTFKFLCSSSVLHPASPCRNWGRSPPECLLRHRLFSCLFFQKRNLCRHRHWSSISDLYLFSPLSLLSHYLFSPAISSSALKVFLSLFSALYCWPRSLCNTKHLIRYSPLNCVLPSITLSIQTPSPLTSSVPQLLHFIFSFYPFRLDTANGIWQLAGLGEGRALTLSHIFTNSSDSFVLIPK